MAVCSLSVPSRLFWLLALLALLSGPALAGRDAEYSIDKVYTTSNVWSISINVTRKSCAMSTLREDFSMMALGGDYRGSMPSFYLMFANRSWGEEDGKTYDVEMEYGGGKTWTGGGIGLDLMRVRGIAIEDIGDVFFNQFSGVTSIKLKVDGQSRGEFVLEDVEKAFRKLTECMRSVSSGVISLEKIKEGFGVERAGKPLIAEDHGDWSKPVDKADATPQGQDKVPASDAAPAPSGRADQGSAPDKDRNSHQDRDSRTPVLGAEYFLNENYYDRRNGWTISINKARMSCNNTKLFDTKSLIQLGGDAHGSEYSFYLLFQDEKFFLEEGRKHSVSVTFNGRSTWDAEGLGVSLANGVLGVTLEHINKDSIVEFAGMSVLDLKIDGVSSGTYSLAGTRKALLRMLDCIKDIEAGRISLATIGEGDRSTDDRAPSTDDGPDRRGGQGEKKGQGAGTSYAYGTGFFVNGDGYLLTNAHVVEGCKDAMVRQGHSDVQPATIVARETTNDLAILKVAEKSPVFGKFRGAPQIRLGDSIVVFGYPLAGMLSSTGNLTTGLISSLTGAGDDVSKLQISAPVQSGNSGGAVVDQSGRIVGVVVAKANIQTRGTEDKPDVEVIQNVNFAIKAGMAQFFLDANQIHYEAEAPGDDLKTPDVADIARSFTVQVACEMRK